MTLLYIFESLRPRQWVKNLFIFAALLFSRNIFNLTLLFKVIFAFFIFCAISGCVYILNDIADLKEDRRHPSKSRRPLASGRLKVFDAVVFLMIFIPFILMMAYGLNFSFFLSVLAYLMLQVVYSLCLKRVAVVDVLLVSSGFVIRVVGGAVAAEVEISSWLLASTVFLSLFLTLSKRRYDLMLNKYTPSFLDRMIVAATASTLVSYTLYTVAQETVIKFGTRNLVFTAPFVFYGVFRYLYLFYQKGKRGNPEDILFKDTPLIVDIILWTIATAVVIYG